MVYPLMALTGPGHQPRAAVYLLRSSPFVIHDHQLPGTSWLWNLVVGQQYLRMQGQASEWLPLAAIQGIASLVLRSTLAQQLGQSGWELQILVHN
jgi:hypothetical protein